MAQNPVHHYLDGRAAAVADRLDREAEHLDDAWQIPAPEAAAIHQLIVAAGCRSLLEIGVSYGYSTLHLAHAARITGGHVHACEASEKKFNAATKNLTEAGLTEFVTIHLGRAQDLVPKFRPHSPAAPSPAAPPPFDFLFIDAVKAECFEYLDAAWPRLAERCVILTDNSLTHAVELAPFIEHLRSATRAGIVSSTMIAIGNGFEVTLRR